MKNINYQSLPDEKFWKRLGLVLSIVACFIFFGCKGMLPVPQVSQASDILLQGNKAIATPLNVTASHGQKRQITISWTPVSNAKYYYIYRAETPHSQFVQIDEAAGGEASKAISVPAGFSGYFKVAAVTGLGEISELSLASYGTSLASPVITDIQQDDEAASATIYWFMENLNEKSYLSSVQFNVICYNPDGSEKDHILLSKTENTFCTFENLNTATIYSYDVEAYLLSDQTASEKSMKVDKATAVSLIPQVANFTATEGTEKDQKVTLTITLPQMAKTPSSTGTGGTDLPGYEEKPLYFKIQRFNEANQIYDTVVDYLSFNGSTTPLNKDHEDFGLYTEGNTVTWYDTSVERGIKYKYRVLSYVDNYFENGSETARKFVTHDPAKANVKTGWAANIPAISSTQVEYTKDIAANADDKTITAEYIKSASLKLNASWESLGKEDDYKYVLVEKRFKIKSDNGDVEDETGTEKLLIQANGSTYFDSITDIKDFEINFNFSAPVVNADYTTTDAAENASIRGYYKYSIYVIPSAAAEENPSPDLSIKDKALVSKEDSSTRLVFNGEVPTPVLNVADGYKSKAIISYNKQDKTTYKLVRETLDADGKVIPGEDKTVDITEFATYEDETLEAGKAYQYTLYASTTGMLDIPSSTVRAYTLGKPDLTFDEAALDYSTITLKWRSAVSPLEADSIKAGTSTDKHVKYTVKVPYNGTVISYDLSSHELNGTETVTFTEDDYTLNVINGTDYIFKLKKNIEYFDYSGKTPKIAAENAGKSFGVTLVVSNDRTEEEADNHNDETVQARTLGPANSGITATEATSVNNITVKWNKIPGIEYYAVRRTCPATTDEEEPKDDIIYVSKDGTVTVNEEAVSTSRTVVSPQPDSFILTDQHCTATDAQDSYQTNQAKIAWGLEFEYTVIPVLSTDDNPFEDFDKVTYTDDKNSIVTAKGYTPGYGLNVVATKAESADSVTVKWDKPNEFAKTQPKVWCRKENSADWIGGSPYTAGTTSCTIHLPDSLRADKVEFAITYDTNETAKFEPSYLTNLSNKKDSDGEALNVGYQFTLTSFYATAPVKTAETFSEQINWSKDQNGERKKGAGDFIDGDCYEIQILNKNCSNKWYTIATLNKAGEFHPVNMSGKWYDITITDNGNDSATILPGSVSDAGGVHDGLLKVQRDYKHYYRLVAKRKTSAEGPEITAVLGDITNTTTNDSVAKEAVFGVRKISDEEFVKNVCLIVADASYKCGVQEWGATNDDLPNDACIKGATDGKFGLFHRGGTKNAIWGTKGDYKHIFYAMPSNESESFTSAWTINIPEKSTRGGADGNKYYYFCPVEITVSHESGLPSYSGKINFSAGKQGSKSLTALTDGVTTEWTVTATSQNTSKTYSASKNKTEFKKIFPYQLGAGNGGYSAYTSSIPVFDPKSNWWEVRE
ncbi:MAG: hypothetical protein KIG70_09265 [Treponema sp.]|uniref:hypothetical protein n=1 Tax=Treponema sp. TaxID=166 RepID=UPI001DDEBE79|nr:hypothetical protein [Treponema sp.]MBS7311356.1 hypothetical protein [Treponema sp.]